MELNSKEYQIYRKIDFVNRYEILSKNFQFEDRLEYTNNEVLGLIAKIGHKVKYVKSDNFFKVEEKIDGVKFYLNICLKYSNAELIIGATDIAKNKFVTGDVFGGLYSDIKFAEGIDLQENIKKPKFRNYQDLEIILKEAFSIYSDFKKEVAEVYCITNPFNDTINIESSIFEPESELEKKLTLFIEVLKDRNYPSYHYFDEIKGGLKEEPKEFKQRLKSSFSITQYANFTRDLEDQLKELIELVK